MTVDPPDEEEPATANSDPPVPVSPLPADTEIAPPAPPVLFPLVSDTEPLGPEVDEPVDTVIFPLTPADPAAAVAIATPPLDVATPCPARTPS